MNKLSYSKILLGFLPIIGISACVSNNAEEESKKPNIILIMADDLGYGDINAFVKNDSINTPNIDYLANNGLKCTNYHSNGAVCTPTRAALLTGRYQQRAGLEGVIYVRGETRETGMDIPEITIADLLKQNEYKTACIGKWHLGYKKEYNPVHQGFDEFYGYTSGNIDYISHYDNACIYDWWHNLDTIIEEGYVTDLVSKHSVDFIKKNENNPFFLYVAHEAPHWPYQGRSDKADRLPGQEFTGYGSREDIKGAYKEMIEVMDESVGEILNTLRELKLEKNTLIVFCSDNGPVAKVGSAGELSGFKGSLWEGGHRVPGVFYWPGKIAKSETNEAIMSFDIFPTTCAVSNTQIPENLSLDGIDLSSLLFKSEKLPERDLFWRYRGQKACLNEYYKLLIIDSDTMLFDIKTDIGERNNLVETRKEELYQLLEKMEAWERDMAQHTNIKTK